MSAGDGGVHYENPFVTPPELREPARQLRGRLASPVTIWTSGSAPEPAGLTLSSVVIAEGEPSVICGVLNPTTDLWARIRDTKTFVVHILERRHRSLADAFAGLRPSPGGLFATEPASFSPHGPLLTDIPTRGRCRLVDEVAAGHQRLLKGEIEAIDLAELDEPLIYYRGRYRALWSGEPA
jgi:3-hydroxy-9,10-secoandrosta-1,3,5(10)-triene-9,17-dione monooxygenase reductase component